MADVTVREASEAELPAIVDLQNALLSTTTIEWTDTPHTVPERAEWLRRQRALRHPVLVAVAADDVVGWCSFGDFRDTIKWPGYRFTVEHTLHVRADARGRGIGTHLLRGLIGRAHSLGKHVMIAGVDADNAASIRLHERLGFTQAGRLREVGYKFGRWLDLVFLQLAL